MARGRAGFRLEGDAKVLLSLNKKSKAPPVFTDEAVYEIFRFPVRL